MPGNETSNVMLLTFFSLSGVVSHLIWEGPGYDAGVDASSLEEERQGIERAYQTKHGKYGAKSDRFDGLYQESDTGMEYRDSE